MATQHPTTSIAPDRIEAALAASYELESLAIKYPQFNIDDAIQLADEYMQRLLIDRITELAQVVMSALSDDRETNELRRIVNLPEVHHG